MLYFRQPQLPKSDVDEDPGGVSELYSAPVFLSVPSDLAVNEGETVRLDCRPAGRPLPDIRWFLDGRQVFDDRSHKLVVNQDGIHSLIFDPVSAKDSGMYTCVAKNKGGETKFSLMFSVMRKNLSVFRPSTLLENILQELLSDIMHLEFVVGYHDIS